MEAFWAKTVEDLRKALASPAEGLTATEAASRLARSGPNDLGRKKAHGPVVVFLSQFKSPIILILLFATGLSLFLGDTTDAAIIFAIVLVSGLLGFWQEFRAGQATEALLALVRIRATALRDGKPQEVDVASLVPGDVVRLEAGDKVPADSALIDSTALFVDESTLTGETFPVEKQAGVLPADAALAKRTNALWMGTHVVSGSARALVVQTGRGTEFGRISEHMRLRPPETEFERGIRRFGYLLMEITLLLVFAIFATNVLLKRPPLDSFLFSLALAVGLTPQLLPAVISINLSHGARVMASRKVIVKRLSSIENLGSMDVLCSDKTGTLTDGTVKLQGALDLAGNESERVFLYAYLNASFEAGFRNPIDEAVRAARTLDISGYAKLDEEPYDFTRRMLSILVSEPGTGRSLMVTKGALDKVLAVCDTAERPDGTLQPIDEARKGIRSLYEQHSALGHRTLGLAYRHPGEDRLIGRDHETGMTFLGFLTLYDPLKENIVETIDHLKRLGVSLRIITGDNRLVAASLMKKLGIPSLNKIDDISSM